MHVSTANYATDVPGLFEAVGDVDVAVAFVSEPGLVLVGPALRRKLQAGDRVRLLIDLETGATDPTALWNLLTLTAEFPSNLLLKSYVADVGILHSKVYISKNGNSATLMTGSANLSGAALEQNIEHGLRLAATTNEPVITEALTEFERLWNSQRSFRVDAEAARLYEIYAGLRRVASARARNRARGSWRNLTTHLAQVPVAAFEWPSTRAAFIIGAITARGYIEPDSCQISIRLGFKANAYKNGRITVLDESFVASDVLPAIPQTIADEAKRALPNCTVATEHMRVRLDFQDDLDTFQKIAKMFAPEADCDSFYLPAGLTGAADSIVAEFVRGFAVASALLTDATSMPGSSVTGLPGQMVVWLRPKQRNLRLYDQLDAIITRRLHITVYHHRRGDRDPHLKLLCDEFQEIGFGIDWWDRLLRAGSQHNQELFPQI